MTGPPLRPHQQHRAVGGAATDVDHQHAFFFAEAGFEIQTGGNRFVLENHVAEAGTLRRALQNTYRLRVGFIATQTLEVNRATNYRLLDGFLKL